MRPGEFVDYYEILGLSAGASAEDVREAWRRCARLYHPDLNPRKTSFRFRRAKEAYDTLNDPVRRKEYDRIYRLRAGLFGRNTGSRRAGGFVGNPPGSRNPPPPGSTSRSSGGARSRPPSSESTRSSASSRGSSSPGASSRASHSPGSTGKGPSSTARGSSFTGAPGARESGGSTAKESARTGASSPPPGARNDSPPGTRPTPGASDVRTRTTFRPATVSREESGANMVDSLKDAILQGGASRVTVKHNGNVVWEAHITSALIDDMTRWLVGPLSALLRLLGQEEKFQIELTNELMEDYNQANVLYDEGKLAEAKAAYKRCIDRDKYFAPAHLSLGAVYEAQQDIPVAIQCYQNAVKIDPVGEAGRFARENLRRLRGY